MNWEALGAIGEIVGAIAVVLTLGYLAVQIRQSNRSSRAAARQALIDTFYDSVWEIGRDRELSSLFGHGFSNFESLSDGDKARFLNIAGRFEGNLYNGILLRDAGFLDAKTLNEIGDRFIGAIQARGGTEWRRSMGGFTPLVEDYIEKRIKEVPEPHRRVDERFPYWIKEDPQRL